MQHENKKSEKQLDRGYYIALILCVAAIGISGYLFTRTLSADPAEPEPSRAVIAEQAPVKPSSPKATEPVLPAAVSELPREEAPVETGTPAPTETVLATVLPVEGAALQSYSMDHLAYNPTMRDWRTHDGADYAAAIGTAVHAAADGVVESVYDDDFLGRTVTVSHAGGYVTRYSNLAEDVAVNAGDTVCAGQVLGAVGGTALLELNAEPHLHFSVSCYGASVDPEVFFAQ